MKPNQRAGRAWQAAHAMLRIVRSGLLWLVAIVSVLSSIPVCARTPLSIADAAS
jgi:hypothetical protein